MGIGHGAALLKLNIGSGVDVKAGYTSVDLLPVADIVMDIERDVWPWLDGEVDEILAEHVVEHLDSLALFMNNCHRILKVGSTLTIKTPNPLYEWFWQDPTHKHGYTMNTFSIYCIGHPMTTHTGIIPWDKADVSERLLRVNGVIGCEILAVMTR